MTILTEEELLRKQYRHRVKLTLRCDLLKDTDRTGPGWPATISSPPDTFFPGLLMLTPHSARGKELCAALQKDDLVYYRVGWDVYSARVACKGNVTGQIWLHACDVAKDWFRPVRVFADD